MPIINKINKNIALLPNRTYGKNIAINNYSFKYGYLYSCPNCGHPVPDYYLEDYFCCKCKQKIKSMDPQLTESTKFIMTCLVK